MKGARPCRASNPQRGSIEPAPSPAFRPPLRRRPGRSAPRLFFDLRGGGAPPRLAVVPVRVLAAAVPSSSSPVVSSLVPLAPARSLASLALLTYYLLTYYTIQLVHRQMLVAYRTRKFVAWGSMPRPGGRATPLTLGHHHKPFWSGRTARSPHGLDLVGALLALWRA